MLRDMTKPTAVLVPEACRTYQLMPMNSMPEPNVVMVSERKYRMKLRCLSTPATGIFIPDAGLFSQVDRPSFSDILPL